MNGTEKQIEWANEIKSKMISGQFAGGVCVAEGIESYISRKKEEIESLVKRNEKEVRESRTAMIELCKKQLDEMVKIHDEIKNCDDAVWFIDNRDFNKIMNRVFSIE
jgi:hypothetical protein